MRDELIRGLGLFLQSSAWSLSLVGNVFFLYRMWTRFVQMRRGWFWRVVLYVTLGITSVTIIWIGDHNFLYAMPAFFLMGLLCSRGKLLGRATVIMIFFSLIMSVNATLDTYLEDLDRCNLLRSLMRPVFYGGFYLAIRNKLPKNPPELSPRLWKLVLTLAAMPLCSLIAVVLLTSHRYESLEVNAVGLNQGLVILPVTLLTSFMLLAAILVLEDHERLEQANHMAQLREVYYQNLRQQEIQVRRLRHDLNNHLAVLQGLLAAGDQEKTLQYLKRISDSEALQTTQHYCDNEIANVVLAAKMDKLGREGLRADIAVSLPQNLPVADVDLCALLGNALDNAIEGSLGAPEGKITVRCKAEKGLFMLQVRNPVGGPVQTDLSTTKKDKSIHGFGIPGMREIVERYHGTLDAGIRNGQFELLACLPTEPVPDMPSPYADTK